MDIFKMKEIDSSCNDDEDPLRLIPFNGVKQEIEFKTEVLENETDNAICEANEANSFNSIVCKVEKQDDDSCKEEIFQNHDNLSKSKCVRKDVKRKFNVNNKSKKSIKQKTSTVKKNKGRPVKNGVKINKSDKVKMSQPKEIVKDAVYNTFLKAENGKLGCLKYKNIEFRKEANVKGFSLDAELLEVFSKSEGGKVMYLCDDCDFVSESEEVFKVHFVMHANTYFIVETINKTSSSHYCYICDKKCLSGTLLRKHLEKHKRNDKSDNDNAAPSDVPQCDYVLKAESIEDINDEEEMNDHVMQESHFFTVDDFHHSENELEKEEIEDVKVEVLEGIIKFEPQNSQNEADVNMDVKDEFESKYDVPMVKVEPTTPIIEDNDETKLVKCERCKFESPIGQLDHHKCDEVRQCEMCEKILRNKLSYSMHKTHHFCSKCSFQSSSLEAVLEHKKSSPDCSYKCDSCDFRTVKKNLLQKHIVSKSCTNILKCDLCGKVFQTNGAYRYHKRQHSCKKCNFKSSSTAAILEHITANVECWFKCSKCDFKTDKSERFRRHRENKECFIDVSDKSVKLIEIGKCDICGYKSNFKKDMEKHSKVCNASFKGSFTCKVCGKACRDSRSLIDHRRLHYCRVCSFVSASRKEVLHHKLNSPDCMYKCGTCDFKCVHRSEMSTHKNQNCKKKPSTYVRKRYTREPFCCDICSYRSYSKINFEAHVKKHSDPKPFHCSQCDYKCAQRGNLQAHEKKHIKGKTYSCTICDFQCSHIIMFRNHKKTHGLDENSMDITDKDRDPRFYYCNRCEFRSKHLQYLKSHVLKHDNIRPYLCPYCGKAFASSIDYNTHKSTVHTEIITNKVFKCSYCDYSYRNKATVKIHERKHTGAKPYTCEFCSYSTSYSGNMSLHRKKHAGKNS